MRIRTNRFTVIIAAALLVLAAQRHSLAGSARWSSEPVSNDWTTPQNWMPNTVPNGPADSARFATSSVGQLFVTGLIEVASLNFDSDADAFTIMTVPAPTLGTVLFITGAGISNTSGQVQTFSTEFNDTFTSGIFFENNATAGEMTSFVGAGGLFNFSGSASAGSASFDVSNTGSFVGEVSFSDDSTAAESTISVNNRGNVSFGDSATAADAVITASRCSFRHFQQRRERSHYVERR